MDGSEKCHLDIIEFHARNKHFLDIFWYGAFIASVEVFHPKFIKPVIKGQPWDFVVFRFEINNINTICITILWCCLQNRKPIVSMV